MLAEVDFSMDLDLLVLACEAQESPIFHVKTHGKTSQDVPTKKTINLVNLVNDGNSENSERPGICWLHVSHFTIG